MFSLAGLLSICVCQRLGVQGRLEAQSERGWGQAGDTSYVLQIHAKESGLGPVGNGEPWEGIQQRSEKMGFPSGCWMENEQ